MEFLAMALGTGHSSLRPVNISRNSFILSQVLSTNTGAMTGNTVVLRRRSLLELMIGKKPPTHLIRAADMTLATGRMTLLAVVFKSLGKLGAFLQISAPGFKNGSKATERCVNTNSIRVSDIPVAGVTITLRRVSYQPLMGHFLVFSPAIATMADNTTNFAMGTLDKLSILQKDLLPYLQRR